MWKHKLEMNFTLENLTVIILYLKTTWFFIAMTAFCYRRQRVVKVVHVLKQLKPIAEDVS